ncbi:phytoene/squalene synthase family protein [Sinorhizobium sp. BG8]|uniref:phytoene/squalene synthase family protein n=1 Tax=Sinorhizobium sp. BG8 TaxID=2613773 RepID=UPI00193C90A7|nr:phytoene/squalene synthase family protein [Sinorhizobium sp. BG8]QRM55377.1 phytoene/squalene synthase family protein [Sinorhizobium sp. BG8]
MSAEYSHCLEVLRETDRDRYLACLLAPEPARGALAALYAFNAEIARVRDIVREALAGEIRLQWWRDLLEGAPSGEATGNPLAAALMDTVRQYHLPVAVLLDMIDARIFDIYNDPMESRTTLEGYAGETASALIQLASLVLDPANASKSSDAAGHAGVAQTIAGTLLLLPIHRRRGQVYIPADLLAATGLSAEGLLAGTDTDAIRRAINAYSGLGREHLRRASEAGGISPGNFPAFVPVAIARHVFDSAEKAGAAVLDKSIVPAQWRRQWWMWRSVRRQAF